MSDPDTRDPALSVVIALVSDTTGPAKADPLATCLDALSDQRHDLPIELIAAHLDRTAGIASLRARFPHVVFVSVDDLGETSGSREHHDVLRARGIQVARGRVVALIEDHATPDATFCASVVAAHRKHDAVIGGAIENGVDKPLNWAVYFCDFGRYQNPLPRGDTPFASDANVSYARSTLDSIRSTWAHSFREVIVNETLRSQGKRVILDPTIVVFQNRRGLTLADALKERFIWGRSYAATRNTTLTGPRRLAHAVSAPLLPVVLTVRAARIAWTRRRQFGAFLRVAHLVALLQICWSLGEGLGYLSSDSP